MMFIEKDGQLFYEEEGAIFSEDGSEVVERMIKNDAFKWTEWLDNPCERVNKEPLQRGRE